MTDYTTAAAAVNVPLAEIVRGDNDRQVLRRGRAGRAGHELAAVRSQAADHDPARSRIARHTAMRSSLASAGFAPLAWQDGRRSRRLSRRWTMRRPPR